MYNIARIEKSKSREEKDEVFIAIEIEDELGKYNYGHWLNKEEIVSYSADVENITVIAESYLVKAKADYTESLNAPEPEDIEEV